jgi:hypothetical protein
MERLVIEDDKPGDWETWLAKHPKDAAAFDGSFACEKGHFLWTLIDYGFCVIQDGCTTIPDNGAVWDLIKQIVGGMPGEGEDVSMDPNLWSQMLSLAVCQLQDLELKR